VLEVPVTDVGWSRSAQAWIASMGEHGDRGRRYVLDPAFKAWMQGRSFRRALDVGCGEGRVCRWLRGLGIETTGLDPTPELIAHARKLDPGGHYVEADAADMGLADASYDLVVSCLSLIDIADFRSAIRDMARVLEPGGVLLVANLTGWSSATGQSLGWMTPGGGQPGPDTLFCFDHYMNERAEEVSWAGIRILNHHRPLSAYMQAFLGAGLVLEHFDEPEPVDAPPEYWTKYRRAPWFVVMSWRKPVRPA
jgi:SAM-dependent methyltransferase